METNPEKVTPEKGQVVRDDGCICPEEAPPKKCDKPNPMACPPDPRFPNTNQTKHCYYSFIDYQRCTRLLGDYPGCNIFLLCYTSLCPSEWTEKWYDQMEKGNFPTKIYPPKPIVRPDPEKLKNLCLDVEEEIPEDIC